MLHACLVPGVHKNFFFRIMILYFTTFILLFHHGKYSTITFSHARSLPAMLYQITCPRLVPDCRCSPPAAGLLGKPQLAFD